MMLKGLRQARGTISAERRRDMHIFIAAIVFLVVMYILVVWLGIPVKPMPYWDWKRLSMSTTVLAYLILFMGFITFLAGAFAALLLVFEEVAKTERVPFRYYAMMVGLISGGLGLIGIGQGLRLLLLILGKH